MLAAELSSALGGPGRPCEGGSAGLEGGFVIFGGKAERVTADKRLPKSRLTALIRRSKYESPSALGCFVGRGADLAGTRGVGGCVESVGFLPGGGLASGAERWPEALAVGGCAVTALASLGCSLWFLGT